MSEGLNFFINLYSRGMSMFLLPEIVNLGIPEKLSDGPKTIQELIHGTPLNPDRLHRFLEQLQTSGIFSFDSEAKTWSNSASSAFLLDSKVKPLLKYLLSTFCLEKLVSFYLDKLLGI